MKAQDLKNSILQLAIQGKLVAQDENDEPAEVLYAKIQAEKQKLIKEGKIKKDKPLPPITEDEIPFPIPPTWKWVRLTDCGSFISGYTPKPDELSPQGKIPYFKVSDMNISGNEIRLKKTFSYLKDDKSKKYFLKNTIVYPKNGGAVFTNKKRILAQDSVVDLNTGGFYPFSINDFDYIFLLFSMIDFRQCYKGTALPTIDMDKLKSKCFPLPPLEEQKRIVARIGELEPLINQYDQAEQELSTLNDKFPEQLKKSILQYAIQGKLVAQDENDEPAEVLYAKIQAEKQKLIKEGKIKKDKPLSPITEDEIPFPVPSTWKWVRLGEIVFNHGQKNPDKPFTYIDISSIDNKANKIKNNTNVIAPENAPSRARKIVQKGDIIYATVRPYLHNTCIFEEELINEPIVSTGFAVLAPFEGIYNKFLFLYLLSPTFDAYANSTENAKGVAYPAINDARLYNGVIPLPPLEEQHRIVARVATLLEACEKLVH